MAKRFYPVKLEDSAKKSRPDEGKRGFEDLRPELQVLIDDTFAKMGLTRADVDACVYESLADFPNVVQEEIVIGFGQADLTSIRNKTGYFIGILKEYRRHGKAISQGNTQDGGVPMPARPSRSKTGSITALPLVTQHKFRELFAKGLCAEHELDKSIYDSLGDFDELTQAAIIERFSNADFSTLKNKTGYMISLLKQARACRQNAMPFGNSGELQIVPEPAYAPVYDSYGNYYNTPQSSFAAPPPPPHHAMHAAFADPFYERARAPASFGYGGFAAAVTAATAAATTVPPGVPPSFFKMCPQAQAILAEMYNSRILLPTDLDECVFDSVATFPDHEQCVICEGFSVATLSRVRNRTAFFIGILKKHRMAVR